MMDREVLNRVWEIARLTARALDGEFRNIRWVAPQEERDSHKLIGYAFVLGDRHAFIPNEAMGKHDLDLVTDCAQQILGYPLHSPQDIARRKADIQRWIDEAMRKKRQFYEELGRLDKRVKLLRQQYRELDESEPPGAGEEDE